MKSGIGNELLVCVHQTHLSQMRVFNRVEGLMGVFITTFKSSKQRLETGFSKFVARDKHKGVLIRV